MRRPYRRCLIHLPPAPFNPAFDTLWQAYRPGCRGDRPVAPTASVAEPERGMVPLDSRFHGNDGGVMGTTEGGTGRSDVGVRFDVSTSSIHRRFNELRDGKIPKPSVL